MGAESNSFLFLDYVKLQSLIKCQILTFLSLLKEPLFVSSAQTTLQKQLMWSSTINVNVGRFYPATFPTLYSLLNQPTQLA